MAGAAPARRSIGAVALLAALLLAPAAGVAQERVLEVTNAGGVPLPAAEVTVFFPDGTLRRVELDGRGRVTFDLAALGDFRRIFVHHIGLRSAFVYPETLQPHTVVRLVDEAVRIDGVTATVSRESCPARGTPGAKLIVDRVAAGYRTDPPRRLRAVSRSTVDAVVSDRLMEPPVFRRRTGAIPRLSPDRYADLRRDRTIDAWVAARGLIQWNTHPFVERFLNWVYPRFDGADAVFFTSRHFLENTDFRLPDSGLEMIGFCYAGDALKGVIELRGDRIARISWTFGTTDPDEDAGGYALFSTDPVVPWLLPREGLYFRLMSPRNRDLYFREFTRYEGWTVDGRHVGFEQDPDSETRRDRGGADPGR